MSRSFVLGLFLVFQVTLLGQSNHPGKGILIPGTLLLDFNRVPLINPKIDSLTFNDTSFENSSSYPPTITENGVTGLKIRGSKTIGLTTNESGGFEVGQALNLSLSGEVVKGITLEGQISDQDIPLQPEGNTATLKEVDQIYISVIGSKYHYTLGDYLLQFGVADEDLIQERVQGMQGRVWTKNSQVKAFWNRSLGEAHSQSFKGIFGRQKDYFLEGKNGEQYITVLSGTEKLYRNGQELKRGEDYEMMYGEGRIDFLKGPILGTDQFYIEFQYTDKNFPVVNLGGEVLDSTFGWNFKGRIFNQSEDISNPTQFNLFGDESYYAGLSGDAPYSRGISSKFADSIWQDGLYYDSSSVWIYVDSIYFPEVIKEKDLYYLEFSSSSTLGNYIQIRGKHFQYVKEGGTHLPGRPIELPTHKTHGVIEISTPSIYLEKYGHQSYLKFLGALGKLNAYQSNTYTGYGFSSEHKQIVGNSIDRGGYSRFEGVFSYLEKSAQYVSLHESNNNFNFLREWGLPDSLRRQNYQQWEGQVIWNPFSIWTLSGILGEASPWEDVDSPFRSQRVQGSMGLQLGSWESQIITGKNQTKLPGGIEAERYLTNAESRLDSRYILPQVKVERDEIIELGRNQTIQDKLNLNLNYQNLKEFDGSSTLIWQTQKSLFAGKSASIRDSAKSISLGQTLNFKALEGWNHQLEAGWQWEENRVNIQSPLLDQSFQSMSWKQWLSREGAEVYSYYDISESQYIPKIEKYRKVSPGLGNFNCLLLSENPDRFNCWESELGEYEYLGWVRDTTRSASPVQELVWEGDIQLIPRERFKNLKGFLGDLIFQLGWLLKKTDTTSQPSLLPDFFASNARKRNSSQIMYAPEVQWKPLEEGRLTLGYTHDFQSEYIPEKDEILENAWQISWEHSMNIPVQYRLGLGRRLLNRSSSYEALAEKSIRTDVSSEATWKIQDAYELKPILNSYLWESSQENGSQFYSIFPSLRVTRLIGIKGQVFIQYGLNRLWGRGAAGLSLSSSEYGKGTNHRAEFGWQWIWSESIHSTAHLLFRNDPETSRWSRRIQLEAQAVF